MGASISHAAAATPTTPLPPPPPPGSLPAGGAPPESAPGAAPGAEGAAEGAGEAWDYMNLPCPVKYEEIQREVMMSLKPELFEGLRFDFNKPLSPVFSLSHSMLLGNMEVPSQGAHVLKIPNGTYEFGANVLDPKRVLIARILSDGRLTARVSSQLTDNLVFKVQAQLTHEPHYSQGMFSLDYKGSDYQAQAQFGNNAFMGFNYLQSVTPHLALGGEAFWLGRQRRSGMGIAARYNTDKEVATVQLASTGMLSLTYVQKVSDKVSLAADFLHNSNTSESTASAGYDYILRQCRLRGRVDTNGVVAAYLEERMNMGVNFLLSAEVDHWKKDYKFGFGMTVGE